MRRPRRRRWRRCRPAAARSRAAVSVPRAGGRRRVDDDVLDQIADDAEHGHLVARGYHGPAACGSGHRGSGNRRGLDRGSEQRHRVGAPSGGSGAGLRLGGVQWWAWHRRGARRPRAVALAEHLLVAAERARRRGGSGGGPDRLGPAARRRRRPGARCSPSPTRSCAPPTPARAMRAAPRPRRRRTPDALPPLDRAALRLAAPAPLSPPGPVAAVVRRRIRAETRGVIVPADDPAFAATSPGARADGFDVNVNLLGEAILGDDEADARLDALCARHAPARRRLRLGEDLGAVRQPRRARLRPRGRAHRRPPAHRLRRRRRAHAAGVRQPRHGGVPRPPPHGRGVPPGARRAARSPTLAGRDRAAGLPARHPRRARRARRRGSPARHARRRRADQGAARQGRQPGDGARRRRARRAGRRRRTAPRPTSTPATRRCSTAASTPPPAAACVVGVGSHNLFDVGLGARRSGAAAASTTRSASRCSRAWRRRRPGRRAPTPAACCSTRRSSPTTTSPPASPTCRAGSTRTPARRTSCARCSRSRPARRRGTPSGAASRPPSPTARRSSTDAPPRPGPAHRAAPLRPRRAVRQRARHRLHPGRQPGVDRRAPARRPPGRAARRSSRRPTGIDDVVARARAGAAAVAGDVDGRAPPARWPASPRSWPPTAGRTHRGDGPRDGQDRPRGRPRGVRGDRLRPLGGGRHARPRRARRRRRGRRPARRRARRRAVELPDRDPGQRRRRRPRRRQRRCCSSRRRRPSPRPSSWSRHVHEAGVPADVVQLVRCPDDDVGRHLVTHPDVDGVVLTGSVRHGAAVPRLAAVAAPARRDERQERARHQPDAPTSTSPCATSCARRSATPGRSARRRAWRSSRRRCTTTPTFRAPARRRRAQPPRRPGDRPGHDGRPDHRARRRASSPARSPTLDAGESWLVEPRPLDDGDRLWSPGVRLGVQPGSWFHRTECFGPGARRDAGRRPRPRHRAAERRRLRAHRRAAQPRRAARSTRWLDRVEVGNAYVNRHTTGAIVRRQPFGGWKRSSVGRGAKTGGPDDILRFVDVPPRVDAADDAGRRRRTGAGGRELFGVEIDRSGLRSESQRAALPAGRAGRRAGRRPTRRPTTSPSLRAAAAVAGVPMEVSAPVGRRRRRRGRRRAGRADRRRGRRAAPRCSRPSTTRSAPPATRPASPSTRRRSPTTAGSSCRAGCASRRSPGPSTATAGSPVRVTTDEHDQGDRPAAASSGDDDAAASSGGAGRLSAAPEPPGGRKPMPTMHAPRPPTRPDGCRRSQRSPPRLRLAGPISSPTTHRGQRRCAPTPAPCARTAARGRRRPASLTRRPPGRT